MPITARPGSTTPPTPHPRKHGGAIAAVDAEPLLLPFTIAISSAEQLPWTFQGIHADSRQNNRPLLVPIQRMYLKTGDYSIVGHESLLAGERKSFEDLFRTLGTERERFEREHQRMAEMIAAGGHAFVLIEAEYGDCLIPPSYSKLNPRTIYQTAIAWGQRYRVPWIFCGDRRGAELRCFRELEMWWRIHSKSEAEMRGKSEAAA